MAHALVGSIQVVTTATPATIEPTPAEALFGAYAPGSTVGANATNGSASVASALITATTQMLYLNNTNATGIYYAKLILTSSSGLDGITSMTVGINNGTSTPQITAALSAITDPSGDYVRLEPSSTNTIYLTQLATITQTTTNLDIEVYLADDLAESAYYTMRARLTIT